MLCTVCSKLLQFVSTHASQMMMMMMMAVDNDGVVDNQHTLNSFCFLTFYPNEANDDHSFFFQKLKR